MTTRRVHVTAWQGTPAILDAVRGLHAWSTMEFHLDHVQGVCAIYLELPTGAQLNTNTLTDALERLGLGSITWDTFPNDDNKVASAAIFRMRQVCEKDNYVTGTYGIHAASLKRHLKDRRLTAAGVGGPGRGPAFMTDTEETEKIQAALKASREQTDGIRAEMARKTDLDAIQQTITTEVAQKTDFEALVKKVDEQNTSTEKIVDKNIAQNKMLEKKASIERDMAAWVVRADEMRSNWAREVEAHKETKRQLEQLRETSHTERLEELRELRAEGAKERSAMTMEFMRQLHDERKRMTQQWAEERERMTKQWEKERGRFIAAAVMGSASKRARV